MDGDDKPQPPDHMAALLAELAQRGARQANGQPLEAEHAPPFIRGMYQEIAELQATVIRQAKRLP